MATLALFCVGCGSGGIPTSEQSSQTSIDAENPSASTTTFGASAEPDSPRALDRETTVEIERCYLRLDDYASVVRLFTTSQVDGGEAVLMSEALEQAQGACETAYLMLASDSLFKEAGGVERNRVRMAFEGLALTLDVQGLTLLGTVAQLESAQESDKSLWRSDLLASKEQIEESLSPFFD